MSIKSSIIRRIEEKDKGAYLRLFNDENFGCIGINSNLKPSIYEEERIVSKIIDKSIIDEEVLVVEDKGEFIGYASISRTSEHIYHIGQFVIRKDKQRQGYGTKLMKQIKRHASQDNCEIVLECISSATEFFKKQGFFQRASSTYIRPSKKKFYLQKESLFVDYETIREKRETEKHKNQVHQKKLLNSDIVKEVMKL